jgi:predicted extracellular nuclease
LLRPTATVPVTFAVANPRPPAPEPVGGSIRVATFNVLNYFTTIDDGTTTCGPAALLCRGANSTAELTRQRDKIVSALAAIDADVVGLVELENNASQSLGDLVDSLNAVIGTGSYSYIDSGVIGTDAIKVGLIYKSASVTPVGLPAILDSNAFLDPNNTGGPKNRPALAQTFEENGSGAKLTVVVNHLKSKGSSCGSGDDSPETGQGNCNGTRTAAAAELATWLATDPTGSGDPDVLIIGDLNAYAKEDPISALVGAGYTDLVNLFGGENAYAFLFDGQLGYLVHALANNTLASQVTGTAVWNINADEVNVFDYNDDVRDPGEMSFEEKPDGNPLYEPNAFRSSDHDPVVVGLHLDAPVVAIPGDVDGDGDVDIFDILLIIAARNTPASGADDPRDINRDGVITFKDARQAGRLCTRRGCAPAGPPFGGAFPGKGN